ncbi:MFS transporter [Wenxinia marina]|uniref:Arabinose efflux permease n=1 Tax=Wenxinia marina DSM 24838 TaxID=1123501 RepID=A0A0D0QFG2_9RHOB|nr:MFS transporter [Wenxinia marina]KIQ69708.1 Arabinose efflux permease [Wenxinia marina DSM 24838]GGL60573.1 MFS transporter [Wenxinia marina]
MRLLLTFAPLFLSVILLQLSSGGVGPLDALVGLAQGFTPGEVGILGSAHFLGFFLGCWWAPRLMGTVGHARAYASCTALGAIGLAAHVLVADPWAWTIFRIASGVCIAGCYTVIEAWLQAAVTNETRGRAMGTYRVVDVSASFAAQFMIGALANLEVYIAYNLLTIFCCASILPLAVSRQVQPVAGGALRLWPRLGWACSPLATIAVVVSAISGASFRMVGPIYGSEVGLAADQIGVFLATYVAGGALAQYPAGWLADRFDRRSVLIGLSAASVVSCALTVGMAGSGWLGVMAGAALFGVTTVPIYSVATAHAHDFCADGDRVELSAAMMFFYAVGAIAAPWSTSALIAAFGPSSLFVVISLAHVALIGFGLFRRRARPAPGARTRYVWAPRTSFWIGRLTGRERQRDPGD